MGTGFPRRLCFAVGGFYSKQNGKNKHAVIHGMAYSAAAFLAPVEPPSETQDDSDKSLVSQETLSETLDLPDLLLTSPALDEPEPDFSALEMQQSPGADNDEAEAGLSETMEPESAEPPAQDLTEDEMAEAVPEIEEQPTPPESEPDEPEENPQERIEAELQKQLRDLQSMYDPDFPYWQSHIDKFVDAFLEKHHFADASEHDRLYVHLQWFQYLSPDRSDYWRHLNALYDELWPNSQV